MVDQNLKIIGVLAVVAFIISGAQLSFLHTGGEGPFAAGLTYNYTIEDIGEDAITIDLLAYGVVPISAEYKWQINSAHPYEEVKQKVIDGAYFDLPVNLNYPFEVKAGDTLISEFNYPEIVGSVTANKVPSEWQSGGQDGFVRKYWGTAWSKDIEAGTDAIYGTINFEGGNSKAEVYYSGGDFAVSKTHYSLVVPIEDYESEGVIVNPKATGNYPVTLNFKGVGGYYKPVSELINIEIPITEEMVNYTETVIEEPEDVAEEGDTGNIDVESSSYESIRSSIKNFIGLDITDNQLISGTLIIGAIVILLIYRRRL